jgi:hypothetical protein
MPVLIELTHHPVTRTNASRLSVARPQLQRRKFRLLRGAGRRQIGKIDETLCFEHDGASATEAGKIGPRFRKSSAPAAQPAPPPPPIRTSMSKTATGTCILIVVSLPGQWEHAPRS